MCLPLGLEGDVPVRYYFSRAGMAAENVPTSGSERCRQLPYPITASYILIFLASATKRYRTDYLKMVIALEEVEHRDKAAVAASLIDKMWCSVRCQPVVPLYSC